MKRTVVLLVLTLAVAGWVYWMEVKPETKVKGTDQLEQVSKNLVGALKEDMKGFTLQKEGSPAIKVELVKEEWVMSQPVASSTEEATVKKVLWDLDVTEKQQTIETGELTPERLAQYGLDEPKGRLDVVTTEGSRRFTIGGPTREGEFVYVREGSDGPVHLVKAGFAAHLDITVFQMRRKQIMPLVESQVGYIRIFGRTKAVLNKEGAHWNLTDPFKDYADPDTVAKFLEAARGLQVVSFVSDDPETLGEYGLGEPEEYVTVAEGRGGGKVVTIQLGDEAPAGDDGQRLVYACLREESSVFTLQTERVERLFPEVPSLQAKTVTRMDPFAAKLVTAAYGVAFVEFEKPDFDWRIVKPFEAPADNAAVNSLLDAFAVARIQGQVSAVGTKEGREYGFDVPSGTFSYVEGQTRPVSIVFGDEAGAGLVYARRTETPVVFTVSKSIFQKLGTAALQYRSRQMQSVSLAELESLQITRGGQSFRLRPVASSTGGVEWRMVEPAEAPANMFMMIRVAPALASTTAVDLIERNPADLAKFGLAEPEVRIVFTLSPPEAEQPRVLLIGKAAASGDRYAMLEGGDVVFTVKKGLASALADEVRDPAVFSFLRRQPDRVEFRTEAVNCILKPAKDSWTVESPEGYTVSGGAVVDELEHLGSLETVKFVSYKTENLSEYGLAKPRAVVRIVLPSGVAALSVGDMAKTGHYFAASTTVDGVFLLTPGDLINVLEPEKLLKKEATPEPAASQPAQ